MLLITKELFNDARVELLTAILLGLCIQPMLLSTFLYGTLPGMALAIWSVYFVIRAMRTQKPSRGADSCVCIDCARHLPEEKFLDCAACGEHSAAALRDSREEMAMASFVVVATALSMVLPTISQKIYEEKAGEPWAKARRKWLGSSPDSATPASVPVGTTDIRTTF